MLVIYHSRDPFPARQAAALHTGRLPAVCPQDRAELAAIRQALGGDTVHGHHGLWFMATDDPGRCVFALGGASRHDVVHRAFHGLADICGVDGHQFLLQHVGPEVAWTSLKTLVLRKLGLAGWALRVELNDLRQRWPDAECAAACARQRLESR